VFSFTNCVVSATNASTTGSCSGGTVGTQLNGSNGLHLLGNATATSNLSGSGTISLTMDWTGTATGTPNGSLPLNWKFTPTLNPQATDINSQIISTLNYTLSFKFNGSTTNPETGSWTSGTPVIGSDSVMLNSAVTSWEAILTVADNNSSSTTTLNVLVPSSSVDINNSTIPEPANILLITSGLAYLILRRRKRA
jgi:hypothetical protein